MLKRSWSKLAFLLTGGAVILQAPACTQTASLLGDVANIVTAGGVIYLVSRVLE